MSNQNDQNNYFKLQFLIREVNIIISKLLNHYSLSKDNLPWNENKFFRKEILSKIVSFNKEQKIIIEEGNLIELDISILYRIVYEFKTIPGLQFDKVKKLKDIRNSLAHNSSLKVNNSDYDLFYKDISDFLIANSYSNEMICKLLEQNVKLDTKSDLNIEANKLKDQGNSFYKNKEYFKAINEYTKALKEIALTDFNLSSIIYCNISNSYFELYSNKKYEDYLDESSKYAKLSSHYNPNYLKAYFRLAKVYLNKQKNDKALRNLIKCVSLDPQNQEVENLIAEIQFKEQEKLRHASMFQDSFPKTMEEHIADHNKFIAERQGFEFKNKDFEDMDKYIDTIVPGYKDVMKGHEYKYGSSKVSQNYDTALKYYSKSASLGNAEAYYNLALFYIYGKGVDPDFKLALSYLEKAASFNPILEKDIIKRNRPGVGESEHLLGNLYSNGIYVPVDYSKAVYWYERGIANNNSGAANNMGLMYLNGKYVQRDLLKAEKLLLFAYSLFSNQAACNLVELYIQMSNKEKATHWQDLAIGKKCLYSISYDKKIREQISNINDKQLESKVKENSKSKFFMDPNRRKLILLHRRANDERRQFRINKKDEFLVNIQIPGIKSHEFDVRTKDITRVYLNQMDTTKDHILYLKYFMGDIIEDAMEPLNSNQGAYYLIKDDNDDVIRLGIYKFSSKFKSNFIPGTKVIIYNPYMRMAIDNIPVIRVNDPSTIDVVDIVKNVCLVCSKPESKFLCGNCKRSRYCSNECKNYDWEKLEHKTYCY